jgi:ribosomal protein L32
MPIIIDCQTCGRKLRVPDDLMDQAVKCPTCGQVFHSGEVLTPVEAPETPSRPSATPSDVPRRPSTSTPRVPVFDPAESRSSSGGFGYVEVSRGNADPPAPGRRPPEPLPERRGRRDLERDGPPRMSECPSCRELIPRSATRCKYCGRSLDDDRPPWDRRDPYDRRDVEPHRGGLILALGIVGLALGLTVVLIPVAWIPGLVAWVMAQNDMSKIKRGLMESEGHGSTQAGWICGIIATCLWGLSTIACLGWWMFVRL